MKRVRSGSRQCCLVRILLRTGRGLRLVQLRRGLWPALRSGRCRCGGVRRSAAQDGTTVTVTVIEPGIAAMRPAASWPMRPRTTIPG